MILGIHNSMETLHKLSDAKSRSITPENLTGAKGSGGMAVTGSGADAARDLGQGWKVNPYLCWRVALSPPLPILPDQAR